MKCLKNHALINSLKRIEIYGFQSRTDGRTLVDILFYFYYLRGVTSFLSIPHL